MTAKNAKKNVQLPRKVAYQPQDFTSHPLLAMLDMDRLKVKARQVGRLMTGLRRQERKARHQHKSYSSIQEQFWKERQFLREIQRAYRRRIENMKARGM